MGLIGALREMERREFCELREMAGDGEAGKDRERAFAALKESGKEVLRIRAVRP